MNEIADMREKILDGAAALFRKKGFNATSISEIVQEVSISTGTLYYYFPSKQSILFEVISKGMNLTLPHMREIFNYDLGPKEKLREVAKYRITSMLENLDFVSVSLRERNSLEEPYRSKYFKLRDELQFIFEEIIRNGIEIGIFPPSNIKLTTFAVLDICHGPARWYKLNRPLKPVEIAEEYSNLICDRLMQFSETE